MDLLHVSLLASRILKWLPNFLENLYTLVYEGIENPHDTCGLEHELVFEVG